MLCKRIGKCEREKKRNGKKRATAKVRTMFVLFLWTERNGEINFNSSCGLLHIETHLHTSKREEERKKKWSELFNLNYCVTTEYTNKVDLACFCMLIMNKLRWRKWWRRNEREKMDCTLLRSLWPEEEVETSIIIQNFMT